MEMIQPAGPRRWLRGLIYSFALTGFFAGLVAGQPRRFSVAPVPPQLSGSAVNAVGLPTAAQAPEGTIVEPARPPELAGSIAPAASASPSAISAAQPITLAGQSDQPQAELSAQPGATPADQPAAARERPRAPLTAQTQAAPSAAASAGVSVSAPGVVFDGIKYPQTRRDESVVDDYFGTTVKDPYRWLEDDNSAKTRDWVSAQNELAESYLSRIPERGQIVERLKQLWNYERVDEPKKIGRYWIYEKNDGLQNQNVLYKSRRLKGRPEVLLDPNTLSPDGTSALSDTSFSDNGKYMAYAISDAGSDWTTWRVRDVETGRDLPDIIQWTKFTDAAWTKDGKGFYYTRYPQPKPGEEMTAANENAKVYYHRLGTAQGQDELVHERPDHPSWSFAAGFTKDRRFLVLYQNEGTDPKNRVWIKDLKKPGARLRPLFDTFDAQYSIVGNDGGRFYVQTTKDAPRGKLVAVDLAARAPRHWKTIIPQASRDVLDSVKRVGKRFVAVWGTDAHQVIRVYGPRGGLKYEVRMPGIGTTSGFSPLSSKEKKRGFFSFSSFNYPRTQFRLNLETGKTSLFWKPKLPIDPRQFEVKQVFYWSKDGTKIPMFIVYKKGLKLDGNNPTYLYGYGGFGVSETPYFSAANVVWMELGGVYAVANLRGGGEYGEDWHDAGRLKNKQNVFDDFISAAEYLIKEGYTSTPKLAIGGGSNGGLLVGAALTQRPELFGAAVPEVGVMDMLRFHLFTVGQDWKSDYGSSETKDGFDTLIRYSPLHNLKPGTNYPATMVMTGDHDDRVVPAHSFKFAAELQHDQAGQAPVLARIERNAGHGAGKPLSMAAQEIADMWAFLLRVLGVSVAP